MICKNLGQLLADICTVLLTPDPKKLWTRTKVGRVFIQGLAVIRASIAESVSLTRETFVYVGDFPWNYSFQTK